MRKRTLYLAAFAGTLVAAGVWSWPEGPLWQVEKGAGRISGFSPDGQVLVTAGLWSGRTTHVTRWHARTGNLLSRAEMLCDPQADRFDQRIVLPSSDGTLALVGQGVPPKDGPGMAELWTGDWFIHDGITGRRILGPIVGVSHIGPFSADNRWFSAYRGEPRSGVRHLDNPGIYATSIGKCIVELRPEADRDGICHFAPDGNSAAVWWVPNSTNADKQSIILRIVELPSGEERRRVEFPPQAPEAWHGVVRWDGRFLTTITARHEPNSKKLDRRQIVYDLEQDPVGAGFTDPLLRDYVDEFGREVTWQYQSGGEWVAHFSRVDANTRRPGIAGWLDWLQTRCGFGRDLSKSMPATVRIIDRTTGKTRYALPRPVPLSLRFSNDGKLLACGEDSIEVWDTDPPPRWPKAIARGFIATGVVVVLGRWRRGRGQPRSA